MILLDTVTTPPLPPFPHTQAAIKRWMGEKGVSDYPIVASNPNFEELEGTYTTKTDQSSQIPANEQNGEIKQTLETLESTAED